MSWEVSPFVTYLTITFDEKTVSVSKAEKIQVSPKKTTTYTLTAENWITRIFHRPHRAKLVLAVNQPESESTLKSEKISKNEYKLEWEVANTVQKAIGVARSRISQMIYNLRNCFEIESRAS